MNTSQRAAAWRATGKSLLAGLLVLLLLVSALASAAPFLHDWLHADHDAPTHYCLVTTLQHGHTQAVTTAFDVAPTITLIVYSATPTESFFISHDLALHP